MVISCGIAWHGMQNDRRTVRKRNNSSQHPQKEPEKFCNEFETLVRVLRTTLPEAGVAVERHAHLPCNDELLKERMKSPVRANFHRVVQHDAG